MKNTIITLLFVTFYTSIQCCSFPVSPFCTTVNDINPNNVILRGYFSSELINGLTFIRLETLRGEEEREMIKVWDNTTFECNGGHQRKAVQMGALNQEVIISIALVDSIIWGNEILNEDYRVPDGLWWETHNLTVEGDSIFGFHFLPQDNSHSYTNIHFDEFIDIVINNNECQSSTSTNEPDENKIKIFPSLVNDYIYIDTDWNNHNDKVMLYNSNGRLIFSKPISAELYLGDLTKGMYIVVVQTDGNKCFHQKIVKI